MSNKNKRETFGLKEITDFKNTIIQRITSNQDILKAVYYQDRSFLDMQDVYVEDTLYSNIYPYKFIPTTDEEIKNQKTYITLSVTDYQKAGSIYFNAGAIYVYVFTHKDLFRTDYGFLRTDFIAAEIHELLNQTSGIGMGKLEFVGMKEMSVNENYHGIVLHYKPVMPN